MVNTDKSQGKMQLESIKKMQTLMQSNALGNLNLNVKKARQKLEQVSLSLQQRKTKLNEEVKVKAETKVKEEVKPIVQEKPVQAVKTERAQVQARPNQQRPVTNNSDRNVRSFNQGQGQGQKQGFANRQNANGQRQGGFNKPSDFAGNKNNNQAQKVGLGRISNADKMDASTLVKPNTANHAQNKKKGFDSKANDDKKSMNKKALVMRGYVEDDSLFDDGERMGSKKRSKKQKESAPVVVAPKIDHAVITTDNLTVKLLAEKIGRPVAEIMGKFLLLGMMVNINSNIDYDSAELIASELGVTLERKVEKTAEEQLADIHSVESDDDTNLEKRPPVVTVMGHVDHGKTSLLDYIRKTNVISGEAGGITQHIGAYQIQVNGELVTFIDTPGHAAFDAMRKRGASLTDVAILVVAADDGVMPQTKESIKFIKEANVPMIVAINKMDVKTANIDRVKEQLAAEGVMPEEWGGDTIMVPISAKFGQNVDKLLEMVLFIAEYQNLRANPNRNASGSIIEARLDKGMGTVATVLVQNGTLKVGDTIVAGTATGKVRAMINEKGVHVKKAGPSVPVAILGLSSVPNAGDQLYVVDEKFSKQILTERTNKQKTSMIKSEDLSLDNLLNKIADSNFKDYNVIIKGDVQGSIEALKQSLSVIQNEEVKVRCIHGGVGAIN